jgi:murE/murF fusion protein
MKVEQGRWLKDILPQGSVGVPELMISALTLDSREVRPGCGFVALPGAIQHGMAFALQAQAAGASVVIWQPAAGANGSAISVPAELTIPAVAINNLRTHLGDIAARFYDLPGSELRVIGVTGTNGKTSTTLLLAHALKLLGQRCGSIGTLGVKLEGGAATETDLRQAEVRTTPDAISLQRTLRGFVDQGATAVAMEVSSHALDQQRVAGVPFELAIFTNLTRDHLDYHASMEAYGAAKAKLFEFASLKSAVINIDDAFGRVLIAKLASSIKGISFGLALDADVRAENIVLNSDGARFGLCVSGQTHLIQTSLFGRFNVVNLLGVIAGLIALGYPVCEITSVISQLQPITGRMNRLGGGDQALVVIDYAHTPDALAQVLINLREHLGVAEHNASAQRPAKLICVFGCGGDRDTGKRALMGAAAEQFADVVVVTSDNPRSESESAITDQILAGFSHSNVLVEHRRERAIELAIMQAGPGDIVLIAGKGHENYQEIRGVKHAFDDTTVALSVLEKQQLLRANGMNLTLSEFAELSGGLFIAPAQATQAAIVQSLSCDTRTLASGGVFVAIKGEHVDGHTLLDTAQTRGAVAALVSVPSESTLPQILVPNVEIALARLASAWCQRMPAKRVAITGSNGKTTVKNLTASILAQAGETLATPGNLNNELGLPLTVLIIRQKHQYAVLEMGAGKPGDIGYLAGIARPHVALVNNAMAAHLERLGDVHGVAEEKSSIYRALLPGGTAVINLDDAELPCFLHAASAAGAAKLTFSLHSPAADVYATEIKLGASSNFTLNCPLGSAPITLALVGAHNIQNALAAASLAIAAGANLAQISAGLCSTASSTGRLKLYPQPGGWNLLDDSYNANPGSVKAGIEAVVALAGRAWVVLGNMAELGDTSEALHRAVGTQARELGVEKLFCLGNHAAHAAQAAGVIGETFVDIETLVASLKASLAQTPGVNLLVKGSRSAKMERVAILLGADVAHTGGH